MTAALPALAALGAALVAAGCGSSPAPAPTARPPVASTPGSGGGTAITPTAETPAASAAQEVNPAGDIPDNQVFVAYTLPSGAFGVRVPEGWARSESGGAVTFTDRYNAIRLETESAAAPTVDSARQTEVPAIRRQNPDMTAVSVSSVTRPAGAAVLITYQATSAQNPVTGRTARIAVERYEFWRAGTEAIVTLSAPVGSDNVDPWRTVTDGFRWQ
jgi:hypothetical protein